MSAIDKFLWLLEDGKWHELKEIQEKFVLPLVKTEIVVNFLWEYNFIEVKGKTKEVRLQPSTRKFIKEIQRMEEENVLSH